MRRTLFLLGQTDIESQIVSTSTAVPGGSKVTTDLVGVLPILPFVMSDRTLAANSASLLVSNNTTRPPAGFRVNLFNLVGDADASVESLHNIQSIINVIEPPRCFNKPVDVFKTSRGRLPKTLAEIPRCVVPRVEAAAPGNYEELQAVCEAFGRWPMIVRARGFHGGAHMVRLNEMADLEAIRELVWPYSGIFLIDFVDYANADGLYQKTRVIMVDGVPYLRHSIFSDDWAIHSGSRDLMDKNPELCQHEAKFLKEFRDEGLKNYTEVFREIQQRIGLDVFGIDFALVNNEIVIFEANACMSFVGARYGDDAQYQYLDDYISMLRRALKKMIVKG